MTLVISVPSYLKLQFVRKMIFESQFRKYWHFAMLADKTYNPEVSVFDTFKV